MIAIRACFCGLLLGTVSTAPGQTNDEAAVRDVVAKYVDARDRRDAKAAAGLFAADADQLVSTGEWRRGRDEVARGSMASSQANAGRRTIAVETVRFVAPAVAIADGRYEIAGGAESRKMWTTIVVTRGPGGWKIAAIRNMLPAQR